MKKIIFPTIIVILILTVIGITNFLLKKDNKKNNYGNNKTIEEIEQYLLNIDSYKADVDVTIISNKNENQYKLIQEVKTDYVKQIVKSPEDIANMELIYINGNLEIRNTNINVSKVYSNYPYISNNVLFLTDFIKKYREITEKSIEEFDDAIYMKIVNKNNQYNQNEILRINKQTLKPQSLEVKDINNQTKVYILYSEIEINI